MNYHFKMFLHQKHKPPPLPVSLAQSSAIPSQSPAQSPKKVTFKKKCEDGMEK